MCGQPLNPDRALYFSPEERAADPAPAHPDCLRVDPLCIFAVANEYHRWVTERAGLGRRVPFPARPVL